MQRFLLGFCAGALALALPWHGDAALPKWFAAAGLAGLCLSALAALWRHRRRVRRYWLGAAGLSLGLVWSGLAHDAALHARLDDGGAAATLTVTGRVLDDPVVIGVGRDGAPARRFRAGVLGQRAGASFDAVGARVRLSWYGAPELTRGELWRWTVVLEGPWSYANPGGFDYERWLLAGDIQGTGYVRDGVRLRTASPGPLQRARRALIDRIRGFGLSHGGVLLALLVGDAGDIPEASWDTFRATGTVHLMVISGLHVSLAAALGFALGRLLGRVCPLLPLWLDARLVGCLFGSAAALGYVMLAGAGLPALRALIMSVITLALLACGRTGRLGSGLLIALAVLLLVEPLTIHQRGFWLSFGAVAILYICLGHRHGDSRLRGLLRGQLAMSLAMLPMVALTTGAWPLTSLPANLVAVPVTTLVVVPAVLLGGSLCAIWTGAAELVLWLADLVMALQLRWLEWLALAPVPIVAGSTAALMVAQAAALCWLAGVPRMHLPALALCWALPLAPVAVGVRPGEYRIMALDVGQGTAIIVDTRRHRLLYDTGPAFPSGFETGSAVVIPSLNATGPPRLDVLVVSHDDVDHSGGADAVVAGLHPLRIFTSTPGPAGAAAVAPQLCHGRSWRWDGVTFRLLDVERPTAAADNDRSCMLLIDDGVYRTLIAGDISTRVEAPLLRQLAAAYAPLHLMFAPHHGSATSSSRALVRVLRPQIVLVNAGRDNRFGHPHPQVVARYRRIGARLYQTGREGALIWRSTEPGRVVRWRRDLAPYWRRREAAVSDRTAGSSSR